MQLCEHASWIAIVGLLMGCGLSNADSANISTAQDELEIQVTPSTTRHLISSDPTSHELFFDGQLDIAWPFSVGDEPQINYCGPTAAMNLLAWYGEEVSYLKTDDSWKKTYSLLGNEMKTNTWDSSVGVLGLCMSICRLGAACSAICYDLTTKNLNAGTLPADMRDTLENHAPAEHKLVSLDVSSGGMNVDVLRYALSRGNPVIVLLFVGGKSLHWNVVTGVFKKDDQTMVRYASAQPPDQPDPSYNDYYEESEAAFTRQWALSDITNDVERAVLNAVGVVPFTTMY
jgi:hypothetical protein